VGARLAQAFADPDPDTGLRAARELARALQDCHPGAAASLREGLEEMFTATNPVESMISIAPTTCRNVKRWKDGQMVCRWTAAGTLAAERSFRRVKGCKGCKDMPALVAALAAHAEEVTIALSA
jgi:putative transposase